MKISLEEDTRNKQTFAALKADREPFWKLWRELADYFLPKRYIWLETSAEARIAKTTRNPKIVDSTGTTAARILASGMMNGVTSPSRPWFTLRVPGFEDDVGGDVAQWADECTRRMLQAMGETNFYNAMAVMYLDLSVFGTAASLIYEDEETVFRLYNPSLGEYYLGMSDRQAVNTFARQFTRNTNQLVSQFGIDNVTESVRAQYKLGGGSGLINHEVYHLITPNTDGISKVPKKFAYRETYWLVGADKGEVLKQGGFNELPGMFPRWEVSGNDSYGTSPCCDALGDVIQLQLETKRKAQGIDKMVSPPIVADIQLKHRPTALLPNGITYVAGQNSIGAKPLYTVAIPIQELSNDIATIQTRIRETLHNPLFNMMSQLNTVRSATEIEARQEEKLVLLGSVLERFENEALDPAINRIFSIMQRKGMLPPPPEEIQGQDIQIQYVSILATVQRARAAAPTERWLAMLGQVAGVAPVALKLPKFDKLLRDYGLSVGVSPKDMNTAEELAAMNEAEQEQLALQQQGVQAQQLVEGARTLSDTDVGGGANALQTLLAG